MTTDNDSHYDSHRATWHERHARWIAEMRAEVEKAPTPIGMIDTRRCCLCGSPVQLHRLQGTPQWICDSEHNTPHTVDPVKGR